MLGSWKVRRLKSYWVTGDESIRLDLERQHAGYEDLAFGKAG
ncbi:hypothetical protein C943_03117 [Mariniradius saccharolyticus AK6]|uniref:Uncharacterized protein n=1 Tax=Mariniradius saccharolyticus AK6 TaxID=1239962 RepID=M7XQL1_9BACT|nr:hypothetical protein C943_03117 [Mariniradius saccharolyticus AK6]